MSMKTGSGLLAATVAAVLAAGAAQASDSAKHQAQSMSTAKISLTEAIHRAEKEGNGHAVSAEYEFKRGNAAFYEVKVLSNDGEKLTRFDLSPATGQVKQVSDEKFEKLFTRLKPESIKNSPTSLTRAIATAETRSGGKAIDAEVGRDGDHVEYSIEVVKLNGDSQTVTVNGANGKVASAE